MKIKNLAVVVAMDVEEKAILSALPAKNEVISQRLGINARRAKIGKSSLWIIKSGVGGVNAAVSLSTLIDKHPIDGVISLGVAGALHRKLKVGDVVIAEGVLQHDSVCSFPKRSVDMAPGQLFLSLTPGKRMAAKFWTDQKLTKWLEKVFLTANPKQDVHSGTVLSGSEFVASSYRKSTLVKRDKKALVVEMEAAGVAQVCNRLGIPFAVVKTVADPHSSQKSHDQDYLDFLPIAADHAGQLAHALVEKLG